MAESVVTDHIANEPEAGEKRDPAYEIETFGPKARSKMMMLGYLLDEDSEVSDDLGKIIDGVLEAGPSNFKRVMFYLHELNQNIRSKRDADPRSYARSTFGITDESA